MSSSDRPTQADATKHEPSSTPPTIVHGVTPGHVITTFGALRNRLAEPWTLGLPAQEVYLSRFQLARSFRRHGRDEPDGLDVPPPRQATGRNAYGADKPDIGM